MIRPWEIAVGLRYTRARRRSHFISFITLVSLVGVTLSVAVLIIVLSVMNGFGKEIRTRILGAVSHVSITTDRGSLTDWPAVVEKIKSHPQVKAQAPYVDGQAMLVRGSRAQGAFVRGVIPEREATVADFGHKMIAGSFEDLKPGQFGVVVGSTLAWKLDLTVGSQVSLMVPQGQATPVGLIPRYKRFTVVGIFRLGHHEYDSALALTHLDDAALLYRMPNTVSGLRLRLDDLDAAPYVAAELANLLGPAYRARDWAQEQPAFFRALKVEKTVMFIILLLIVLIAMFNVISTLVVIVTEKQSDIAILRTLGATPRSILSIFMVQGTFVSVLGTGLGVVFGVLVAVNVEAIVQGIEKLFRTVFIAPEIYFISFLPSEVLVSDIAMIAGASLMLGFLSTLYPAWRASKVLPAEALRYE